MSAGAISKAPSAGALALALTLVAAAAAAEVKEVRAQNSFGISFLPVMVVEREKLLEKHAKEAGLGDVTVRWATGGTGNVGIDALLSGTLDFAATGATAMITAWAKTRGNLEIKGVSAFSVVPFTLNTRNPAVRTIADFTEKSRIAVPGVIVSPQATLLQMEAEKVFGPGQHARLDPITVTMTNPDGMAAMLSGGEIDSHFTTPPFNYLELKTPGVRQLLSSTDVLGGPATINLVFTTGKFHDQNPGICRAYIAALDEAAELIRTDPRRAASIYLAAMNDRKTTPETIVDLLGRPEISFGTTPLRVLPFAQFMQRVGRIAQKPERWQDLFFPEIHYRAGS
jgi:NitT/TauT family transport system substrate-binding protein